MIRQIRLLTRLELCNTFGLNEARYGKGRKRGRVILLGLIYVLLGLLIAFYAGALAWGYAHLGLAELIPAYLLTVTSLLILFFMLFKTGSVLFNQAAYERVAPLPVKPVSIVVSRLLRMYLSNVLLGALALVPGCAVYGWFLRPGASFYAMALLSVLLLPLLPMTISCALGALIHAISTRMRHKNLAVIVLSLCAMLVLFGAMFALSGVEESALELQFAVISERLFSKLVRLYPPAALFSDGLIGGSWSAYMLFAALSITVFVLFVLAVEWKFTAICARLGSVRARRSFTLDSQSGRSPLSALYRRELKRYFASSVYVLNTCVGSLIMVIFAAALAFADVEKLETGLGMTGYLAGIAPALLGAMCAITPTTASAISMEGRQWWIVQSLPISTKTVLDSKLLVGYTIILPGYMLSELILLLFLPMPGLQRLWMLLLPFACLLLSANLGLTLNARFLNMSWESETIAVKQGAATLLCSLAGFALAVIPSALWIALPALRVMVYPVCTLTLTAVSALLYRKNSHMDLRKIG